MKTVSCGILVVTLLGAAAFLFAGCSKTSDKPAGKSSESMAIEPGVSIGPVRSGMTMEQVVEVLGEPDQKKHSVSILEYWGLGLTFLRGNKEGQVATVLCSDSGNGGPSFTRFAGRTKEGIGIGSSRAGVIRAFGEPTAIKSKPVGFETLIYKPLGLDFTIVNGKVIRLPCSLKPGLDVQGGRWLLTLRLLTGAR